MTSEEKEKFIAFAATWLHNHATYQLEPFCAKFGSGYLGDFVDYMRTIDIDGDVPRTKTDDELGIVI